MQNCAQFLAGSGLPVFTGHEAAKLIKLVHLDNHVLII